MKKVLFFLLLCSLYVAHGTASCIDPVGEPIDFVVETNTNIINPGGNGHSSPRGPVCPPEAMLSGHTLYILTSHGDYDLQLLSSDGSVVYETFVSSTVNEVVLPSSLTGCFKLQLWAEPYVFIGEIEL
ncbi:MAG: hypothetical protein IKP52_06380 [Prevotella sp.]|nr:hypothetical protein [Prevotella sp.]MBR7048395.1 hypothetical protein [Prevotella sp.]